MEPTPEELKWFARLELVVKAMPDTVWLYANSAGLSMMRKGESGEHAVNNPHGGMDADYLLESVQGNIDGGDW